MPSTVRNKYLRKDEICSKALSQLSVDDLTFLLNDLGCTRGGSKNGMETDRAGGAAADTSAHGQNDEQRNATIQMLVGLLKSDVGGGDGGNTSNNTSTTSNNRRGNGSSSGGGGGGSRDGSSSSSSSSRTLFSSNSINRGSSGNPTTETKDERTMKKAGYNKGASESRTTLGGTTSPPGSPSQRRTKQQPTPVSPSKMPNRHAQPGSPKTSQRS